MSLISEETCNNLLSLQLLAVHFFFFPNFHLNNSSAVFADHCFSRIPFPFLLLYFKKVYVTKLSNGFSLASPIFKSREAVNCLLL